jgi:hypothetical protein
VLNWISELLSTPIYSGNAGSVDRKNQISPQLHKLTQAATGDTSTLWPLRYSDEVAQTE